MPTSVLFGPPGTGKTTKSLEFIQNAIANGTDPRRIAFSAFTRKAAHEAIERFRQMYPQYDEECYKHWGTLHRLAYRNSSIKSGQVITAKHYEEFGKEVGGYTFSNKSFSTGEYSLYDGELGDICLQIYSFAKSCQISIEEAYRKLQFDSVKHGPTNQLIPLRAVIKFAEGLNVYKRREGLVDFPDMLNICRVSFDVDYFVLDEAQDCTPQQWHFARQLARNARDKLVAGDDDQSIYSWGGADASLIRNVEGHRIMLPTSYRLPKIIFDFISRIAARIKQRVAKTFAPRDAKGELHHCANESELDLRSGGEFLLLARTNHMCRRFIQQCEQAGVVYKYGDKWSNDTDAMKAVLVYETLRRGESVRRSLAELACRYADGFIVNNNQEVNWGSIVWPFSGQPDWMTALIRLSVPERQYIRALRANGESLTQPGRIKISTIHAAKGGESENVAVLTDIGRRVENGYWADQDSELRVWYTAFSRARERLFVIHPKNDNALLPFFC